MLKRFVLLAALIVSLAACVPVPMPGAAESPQQPVPSGEATPADPSEPVSSEQPVPTVPAGSAGEEVRGARVYIDSIEILTLESFPPQFMLHISGSLPTPCHELRYEISQPDAENRIDVEIYGVADPAIMCAQVLKGFESNIPLGSFEAGTYTVWVNGERVGDIQTP